MLRVRGVIARIARDVESGNSFSEALAKHPRVFPRLYQSLVQAGEIGGMLDEVLARLAQFMDKYDADVDNAVSAMTALIEPVMIVLLAIIVGSIVVALYLPLIEFATQFGQDHTDADLQ